MQKHRKTPKNTITKRVTKPAKQPKIKGAPDPIRVTGAKMRQFMLARAMSESRMCELFGVSPGKMKEILASGNSGINDPVVCYLYRQYTMNPSLIMSDINIKTLYEAIGGENVIRGSDFALILGRELSAYVRYFATGRPSPSLRLVIGNALKLHHNDPVKAFKSLRELCHEEGMSRGFDPLEARTWRK